jgi:hypothetical protein
MTPVDFRTITKLEAAIQQVEAAIELFYAKKFAPAVTLAAAAEGCLPQKANTLDDPPRPEPLFELMKRGAKERFGKTEKEAVERFNRLVYWLKHPTPQLRATHEVTNYDAWSMIVRAVSKINHAEPGSETPAIAAFVEFSRQHYGEFLRTNLSPAS